jgi:ATP-binding cassette subfamily B protein
MASSLPKPSSSQPYKPAALFWQFVKPYSGYVCGAVFFLIIAATTILSLGFGLRYLIDQGFVSSNQALLDRSLYFLLGASLVLGLAAFFRTAITTWLAERMIEDMKSKLFQHIIHFDRPLFDQQKIGDLLGRLNNDTTQLLGFISSSGAIAIRSIIQLIGGTVLLVLTSPKLAGLVFLVMPLTVFPISFLGRYVRKLSQQVQAGQGQLQAYSEEVLGAIVDVQLFQNEAYVAHRFRAIVQQNWHLLKKRLFTRSLLIATVIMLAFSAISVVVWIGGRDVLQGDLTAGALSSFIFYAVVVAGSLNQGAELLSDFQAARGAFDRIAELFHLSPTIIEKTSAVSSLPLNPKEVEFKQVTFAYPSRSQAPAVNKFSLNLLKGQKIALVGPSGAGKSTIFQLLTRLYDPQEGRILIDGLPLSELRLSTIRGLFSIVPQEPVIFNATVYENIAFGYPNATYEEVLGAANNAYVDEFVKQLPCGYETIVGERGVRLSGGQKQRLAIARALLRPSPILLLDEATNALDATSESMIQEALDKVTQNRTALMIAHRLSTVLKADQIIVLDQGRIVQQGTHSELMAMAGLYRTLAEKQYFSDSMTNL